MYRGIQTQQEQLVEDATKLEQIQAAAESAEGRMEALVIREPAGEQSGSSTPCKYEPCYLCVGKCMVTARNQALNTQESITQAPMRRPDQGILAQYKQSILNKIEQTAMKQTPNYTEPRILAIAFVILCLPDQAFAAIDSKDMFENIVDQFKSKGLALANSIQSSTVGFSSLSPSSVSRGHLSYSL